MMDEKLIAVAFAQLMEYGLGLDLSDPNLEDTPERVARMYCRELLCNCCKEFSDWKAFPNKHSYNQIIMADRISFVSLCAHHFLPFTGNAWVAYIPESRAAGGRLVGASKLARCVEHYACRPQLQEHLCHEVMNSLVGAITPLGAMVVMRAIHGCMKCRGVKQRGGSGMITSALHGIFHRDTAAKIEVLDMIKISLMDQQI